MSIAFRGVGKTFRSLRGRTAAVDGLDLDIADGEFFVLLGPSGCGKSTTLNLIAGLEEPTAGAIRFDDRVVAAASGACTSPKERGVAMVFQSYALYPHLNVFENIAFPLRIAKEDPASIEPRVREAADTVHITDLLQARPAELSGGQRQRVAIARAIVRRPRVFLLDEPLSNLDAQLRASTRVELKRLQRELGVTTVYVTHDQTEAVTLGDRIAVLNVGRLEQVGTPDELYNRPANAFVAAFIGSPPMNLLTVGVAQRGADLTLRIGDSAMPVPAPWIEPLRALDTFECVLGIRPEHITVAPQPGPGTVAGRVGSIERLGREALLHVALGDATLAAFAHDTSVPVGADVSLALDLDRAHLFRCAADPSRQSRLTN